jgi:glycosyltransferase involved in cell wall biosynthesis
MRDPLPRHVLLTADAVGGVWTQALDLARGLTGKGVRVTLAVLGPAPGRASLESAGAVPGLDVVLTNLPLDWTAGRSEDLDVAGRRLAELADRVGADLVHLNSPALAAVARFRQPLVIGMHSCLASWWRAVRGDGDMPADFARRTRHVGLALSRCAAVVAPSRALAAEVEEIYRPSAPVVAVPNGRSPLSDRLLPHRRDPRPDFVLASGRLWDEAKGLAVLDDAAGLASAPVMAAGPLAGPAGARGQATHVRWVGALSEPGLARWMADAAVYAAPCLYEPFGLGVLEAAQAGCALVLSDIATFRELWAGAADFVPPRDPAALAEALDRAIFDLAHRRRRAEAARERARALSVGAMTTGMLRIYGEVLAGRARGVAA